MPQMRNRRSKEIVSSAKAAHVITDATVVMGAGFLNDVSWLQG